MDRCLVCRDGVTCDRCADGYYYDGGGCALCSEVMNGCLECDKATVCVECDEGEHWYLNSSGLCGCQVGFIEVNGSC